MKHSEPLFIATSSDKIATPKKKRAAYPKSRGAIPADEDRSRRITGSQKKKKTQLRMPRIPEEDFMTKGKLSLIAASLAVATGLFWARDVDLTPGFGSSYQRWRSTLANNPECLYEPADLRFDLSETYGSVGQASLRSDGDGLRMPRTIR